MIKRENFFRKYIAIVLMMVYTFAFFSQQFHHHEFGITKQEQSTKKYSSLEHKNSINECLACHFLTTGHTIFPQNFEFDFKIITVGNQLIFQLLEKIWSSTKFSYQLRGPPTIS